MDFNYLQIFIPVIGLVINLFIQIVSFKYILKSRLLKSEYLGCFIGLLSIIIIELYVFFRESPPVSEFLAILIVNLIIYSSLAYGYFIFINLGETARRIRILRELYDAEEGLSLEEIMVRYNARR